MPEAALSEWIKLNDSFLDECIEVDGGGWAGWLNSPYLSPDVETK